MCELPCLSFKFTIKMFWPEKKLNYRWHDLDISCILVVVCARIYIRTSFNSGRDDVIVYLNIVFLFKKRQKISYKFSHSLQLVIANPNPNSLKGVGFTFCTKVGLQ